MKEKKAIINKMSYSFSKLLFMSFFIYREVLSNNLFNGNGIIMWGLLIGALLFNIIAIGKRNFFNKEYIGLWLFIVFVFASGYFVAVDFEIVKTWGISLAVSLIAVYLILSYSNTDGKIDSCLNILIITSLSAVIVTRVSGGINLVRMSISNTANSNALGVMMLFSIAMCIYRINTTEKRFKKLLPWILVSFVFAYYMISTASKKAILGTIILLVFWMIFSLPKQFSGSALLKWVLAVGVVAILMFVFYTWFKSNNYERFKYVIDRMTAIRDDESTQERSELMKAAWHVFLQHPVFGVGLNNFSYYNSYRTYSHSTYFELLSCTGIIGTVLFFVPVISIIRNLKEKKDYYKHNDNSTYIQTEYMLIVMAVVLFIYISQIAIYSFIHIYVLTVLLAYSRLNNPNVRLSRIRITFGKQ